MRVHPRRRRPTSLAQHLRKAFVEIGTARRNQTRRGQQVGMNLGGYVGEKETRDSATGLKGLEAGEWKGLKRIPAPIVRVRDARIPLKV